MITNKEEKPFADDLFKNYRPGTPLGLRLAPVCEEVAQPATCKHCGDAGLCEPKCDLSPVPPLKECGPHSQTVPELQAMFTQLKMVLADHGFEIEAFGSTFQMMQSLQKEFPGFLEAEEERMEWSFATFKEATCLSSLLKAEEEIKEIRTNILEKRLDPEEFADAIMCIMDSAGRQGIFAEEVISAYIAKVEKNKARTWVKNDDNTYSHVKNEGIAEG